MSHTVPLKSTLTRALWRRILTKPCVHRLICEDFLAVKQSSVQCHKDSNDSCQHIKQKHTRQIQFFLQTAAQALTSWLYLYSAARRYSSDENNSTLSGAPTIWISKCKLLAFPWSVWSRLHVSQGWIWLLFVSLTPHPPPRLHKEKWKLLSKCLGLISLTSDKTDGVKLTTRTQERRASENVALLWWEEKENPKTIRLLLLLLLLSRDIYHKISKSISLFLLQPAYKCQSVTFYLFIYFCFSAHF